MLREAPDLEAFSRLFLKGQAHSLVFPLMILAEKEECGDEIVLMPQIQGVPSVQRRIGM